MVAKIRCPICGLLGWVVQRTPRVERTCKKGHRWPDGRVHYPSGYVPLGVRLEASQRALHEALGALQTAKLVVLDCIDYLSTEQVNKLHLHREVWDMEQVIKKLG